MNIIISGCISTYSRQNTQVQNIQDHEWVSNTSKLFAEARGIDGGYSDFPPQFFSFYSTYYFLSCLDILDKDMKYKDATIDLLLSKEQDLLKSDDINLNDLYFLTLSLDLLETQPDNKSALISKVMNLKNSDGSFSEVKGSEGTLLDTYRALSVLKIAGADLDQIPDTKDWLIGKWKNTGESTQLLDITSEFNLLYYALDLYGVDIRTSKEYAQETNWILEQRYNIESQLESIPENEIDLITLDSFTEFLSITGGIRSDIKTTIESYLISKQLPSGGYNVFHEKYGESQGTYLALKMYSIIGADLNDNDVPFIYRHEVLDGSGGFRSSYRLISSAENTYLAVQALKVLGEDVPDEEVYDYLGTKLDSSYVNPKDVYFIVTTCQLLDKEIHVDKKLVEWIEDSIGDILNKENQDLEDIVNLMYLVETANYLDINLDFTNKDDFTKRIQYLQTEEGGFGFESPDIIMTYYIVMILSELGSEPLDKESCVSWLKDGQIEDGGFAMRRNGVTANGSDMYSTYISMSCLSVLESEPNNPEELLIWLDNCRVGAGGFSFTIDYALIDATMNSSEASLETTAWGLIAWNHLSNSVGRSEELDLQ